MAFNYFNKTIDYEGQDLHMLRNNQNFPLHLFFDTSKYQATYRYRLNGDYNSLVLDNITVSANGTIRANPYANPADAKIENFFVEVTINGQNTTILIHLHDQLEHVWTSPNTLSLRLKMNAKFGILASFTDGNYADLSFYPSIVMERITTNLSIEFSNDGEGNSGNKENRIKLKNAPSRRETLNNAVKFTLPLYLTNNGSLPLFTFGTIVLPEERDSLTLISGDAENVNNRVNILCLSDGFDGLVNKNDQTTFENCVRQIHTYMVESDYLSPWNHFAAQNTVNIWSYYTKDESSTCTNEGEYVFVQVDAVDYIIDLYKNITDIDSRIPESFTLASGVSVKPIKMSELISLVGLPSKRDLDRPLLTNGSIIGKKTIWQGLLWHKMKGDKILKFPSDPLILNNDTYLTEDIFKRWQALGRRIHLEKSDTTYGVVNKYSERFEGSFMRTHRIEMSTLKFKSWEDYGMFINNIKGQLSSNIGTLYYNNKGEVILSKYFVGKQKEGNQDYWNVKSLQADNVVILSKLYNIGLNGYNHVKSSFGVGKMNNTDVNLVTEIHKSYISLDPVKVARYILSYTLRQNSNTEPTKIYLKEISTPINLNNQTKNTFFHEFSHNYLLDEYNAQRVDFNTLVIQEQKEVTESSKFTNLQTSYDLQDPKPNFPGVVNNIKVNDIRWLWPRIQKIGIGMSITKRGDNYEAIVTAFPKENKFVKEEVVLFRKKSLFTTDYIRFRIINDVDPNTGRMLLVLSPLEHFPIENLNLNRGEFYIISPYWIDEAKTIYQELVHPVIKKWMTDNNKPLVSISNKDLRMSLPDNNPQVIDINDDVFIDFDRTQVIGLFAGGTIYEGYNKGVYHPSGFCIMRNVQHDTVRRTSSNAFCQVCQYILVDFIDPTLHPIIDNPYGNSSSYPKIKNNN